MKLKTLSGATGRGPGMIPPAVVIVLPARHGILYMVDVFQALIAPLSGSMDQVYTQREMVIDIFLMAFIIAACRENYIRKRIVILTTLEFIIVIANRAMTFIPIPLSV
ncbi:MAG: hypothetical protein LBL61_00545 [Elusimicrobiota bacterium]|nr:hypothetical protein [Elusimicrobiota bacterium]